MDTICTKIILSSHAEPEKVFEVICRIVGNEFGHKISLRENSWYHKSFISNKKNCFIFRFSDCAGNMYFTCFFSNVKDNDFLNCNLLNPRSSAIWCAVGKRLVDFFGGKMIYADYIDQKDPKNLYICKDPIKYPPRLKGQPTDEYWYQYHIALINESILTAEEINNMKHFAAYWGKKEDNLVNYLENFIPKIELAEKLSGNLKQNYETKDKSKLKI